MSERRLSSIKAVARRLVPHSLYRRYRQRKVASLVAAYTPREVTHNFGGHTLRVRLADPLAESWYDRDWPEPTFIEFLRERGGLRAGANAFDLGAHQAIVAIVLARLVGEEGRVLAIEAEPHNARVAEINRELNDARNLTVMHAAAAAEDGGHVNFAEGLTGQVDERTDAGTVSVPKVTVDSLAAGHGVPDIVLIDVEGYEQQVLKGASATIAAGLTTFLVEVHDPQTLAGFDASAEEIVKHFAAFDIYVAPEEDAPFATLGGPPPRRRFFLAAVPPSPVVQGRAECK